ncbi:hypothetical protein BD324DRAFT_574415 [Kockovaella imperatae]|uniref:Zn(2)-C6 fungal-type domain-containing protein n=1 Tax=Kockovaella imperatae TaxID=4999 RepID=A0A1Y1USV6_9TREE|nr:hypothetical protein BD324DRAFT_574415 [Kockovaella imperatae]ORX40516.1 hypothetical protein BD324DRAFT_574415 [Kockovaella imperatae]
MSSDRKPTEKLRRGYRACLHCRSRKAKCDLGDIDAPSEPPCSRCRRESRECIFVPSLRGGNSRRSTSASITDMDEFPGPRPSLRTMDPPASPNVEYSGLLGLNPYPKRPSLTDEYNSGDLANPFPQLPQHPPISTTSPKRRRIVPRTADPSDIVVADLQNESDALHILALASGQSDLQSGGPSRSSIPARTGSGKSVHAELSDFILVKKRILSVSQIVDLVNTFFRYHHHFFPMVPAYLIPRARTLGRFASDEPYLLAGIIIIASRNHAGEGMRTIHDRSWSVMRGWISDIECLGAPPSVGLVECLLLLAENLPRDPEVGTTADLQAFGLGEEHHGKENRQAWMLIGSAIRVAYGLRLDKVGLDIDNANHQMATKLFDEEERTFELERARLAWTYCYLFDRHISLRLGKAFWSRGPAVCFQGYSSSNQTGPAASGGNFPFFRPADSGEQDDLAGLIQAYVELTQMMSSAHDILYPNAARTKSLVVYGEYFKYIDELVRSLDGFKVLWGNKRWRTFPLNDAVWAMFYYAQLYICSFSYQAHVERAAIRADEEYQKLAESQSLPPPRPPLSLFPRGAAHSPDARYIFQSCDAARSLLRICVDSLHPGGALPYLPSRFLLWFTYAAILLLKAVYSGAVLRADQPKTLTLIDRLCSCLTEASTEDNDPPARYSRQLRGLKRKLSAMSDLVSLSCAIPN